MSDYLYQAQTNDKKDSHHDVLGHLMPARMFIFVVVDEPGKGGILVRRTYATTDNPYLKALNLSPLGEKREVFPEKLGLWGKGGPDASASVAEHVLSVEQITSYASTSSNYPLGAERFDGEAFDYKLVYIDIAKAKRAGAKLVTTEQIAVAIDEYALTLNSAGKRKAMYIKRKILEIDKEVLVQPHPSIPPDGVFSEKGLAISLGFVKYARVVQVIGLVFTAYDLGIAMDQSVHLKSVRPLEKEIIKQAGGWAGAMVGARIGAAAGAMVGAELGPGAIITGAIGGILCGAVGYFGGSYLVDHIPNL